MDTPEDRLTILERAQLLHDATLRRHGEMLDQHEDRLARLEALMHGQHRLQTELHGLAERLAQRQDNHDEVMRHLAQTLDAIRDMLDRGNGH